MVRASLVILVLFGLIVGACRGAGAPSADGSTPSAPASATARQNESIAPSVLVSPSADPPTVFLLDSIVEAAVDGLSVRDEPGLDGRSLGTLPPGARSIVVDGPVPNDGQDWYRLHALGLPMGTGCAGPPETDPFSCPGWFGWVAAAGTDGSAWLVEDGSSCPDWPDRRLSEDLVYGHGMFAYLACFGGEARMIIGYYPEIPDDAGLGGVCESVDGLQWLACDPGYEQLVIGAGDRFLGEGFRLAIPPGVEMPERGQLVEVTGHYDDPAARDCTHGTPPGESVLFCRARFVVTSARPVER